VIDLALRMPMATRRAAGRTDEETRWPIGLSKTIAEVVIACWSWPPVMATAASCYAPRWLNDSRRGDDDFVLRLLEQFGIETEELGRAYASARSGVPVDRKFHGRRRAITATFDRDVALSREGW
jgi:hypothetical protein